MLGSKEQVHKIFGYPTATVIHSRVPIFQASRRVRFFEKWTCENVWGNMEISGRLGQVHRDLHDLIMTQGEEYHLGELGDLHIVLDPAKVQRLMGTQANPRFLDRLLEDMRQAKVTLKLKNGRSSLGGIVSVVDKQIREIEGPGGFMEKRYLWLVTISRTWVQVYNTTLRIRYAPALSVLLAMKSGYSQAMGRFFLTHSGKMSLEFEDCLETLGVTREEKKVRHEIKADLPLLEKLGVTFKGSMIRYEQQKGMVSFENPPQGQNPSLGKTA
jgi:hypothetical protein